MFTNCKDNKVLQIWYQFYPQNVNEVGVLEGISIKLTK